jgi:hexosaminidase
MKKKKTHMSFLLCKIILLVSLIGPISSCDKRDSGEDIPQRVSGTQDIIPLPRRIDFFDNYYVLSGNVTVQADDACKKARQVITDELNRFGIQTGNASSNQDADITFKVDQDLNTDAYIINIDDSNGIIINYNSDTAAFYAAQSLKQYLWTSEFDNINSSLKVQAVIIKDEPVNVYRGFHIDVSRHFFPKEFIFKIIDQMALYKLNKLQMHLTDDQGWRIPIDKYPDLINVGAYREFNEYDKWCKDQAVSNPDYNFNPKFVNGNIYGGYYTKQDLRDIVAYAADNFIEVIPEIDMPGHMSAAIRAYPWIGGGSADWGSEFSKPMWVCDSAVMQFARDVWDEALDIFPSKTVHIGADEVEKSFWSNSQECVDFMNSKGWSNVNMIQSYFVDQISSYLQEKGRKVIAWDDVMVSNNDNIVNTVSPDIDIMYWRDYKPESSVYAARNGNNIILSPWGWFYLSSANTDENLRKLYNFNESTELDPLVVAHKKGYQACVWTEHIPSEAVFENYVFPRFQAFSEVAWTKGRNFESFKRRLGSHLKYMDRENINYRTPDFMK